MANPFLVLGGIAISVATAAFGILQVPGWVASAQDAAAVNDVSQVILAQTAAQSQSGMYLASNAQLAELDSVKVTHSGGTHVHTGTDWEGKHALAIARSASGAFFARLSGGSAVARGATPEAAVTAAGTTVADGATAEGVRLPSWRGDSWFLPRNFAPDPQGASLTGFVGTHNAQLSLVNDFPGPTPTAVRSTQVSNHSEDSVRWVEMRVGQDIPFGREIRFEATVRLSDPAMLGFSLRTDTSNSDAVVTPGKNINLPAGVSRVTVVYAAAPATATAASGIAIRGPLVRVGATVDVTDISITAAGVDVPVAG